MENEGDKVKYEYYRIVQLPFRTSCKKASNLYDLFIKNFSTTSTICFNIKCTCSLCWIVIHITMLYILYLLILVKLPECTYLMSK